MDRENDIVHKEGKLAAMGFGGPSLPMNVGPATHRVPSDLKEMRSTRMKRGGEKQSRTR